jgi:hypothetical protein
MKKWLIGGGFLGVLAIAALLGILATGVFAQGAASPAPSQAAITPEQAQAAALAANPGASVVKVEQDEENGALVYEVKLDNGLEVQVDASSGAILGTDQKDADSGAGDADNVQEEIQQGNDTDEGGNDLDNVQQEFESQADDAQEAPGVGGAPGQ